MGFLFCFCLLFLLNHPAYPIEKPDPKNVSSRFTIHRMSVQTATGLLFSTDLIGPDIPTINYSQTNVRMGWMLSTPKNNGAFFNGNWEALVEFTNSVVVEGFGDYIGGLSFLVRYNLVRPDSKWVPYFQTGVGVVYSNAHKDETQRAIGQSISITPQASIGVRYLFDKNWSFDLEAMYHHMSNAGTDDRNDGVNALGGFIGLTYYFDEPWK
jgi:hypothetical protein